MFSPKFSKRSDRLNWWWREVKMTRILLKSTAFKISHVVGLRVKNV